MMTLSLTEFVEPDAHWDHQLEAQFTCAGTIEVSCSECDALVLAALLPDDGDRQEHGQERSNTETTGRNLQYLIDDVPDHAREQLAALADLEGDELDEALQELMEDM